MEQQVIGNYEIRSKLGAGGMANVFLAFDTNLEREVALKVLESYFARDPEFAVRFDREAKAITSLEHSNIVPVYDYGQYKGLPYLVMRHMQGGSLGKKLKDGPLALEAAAGVLSRIASALDFAHSRGIIHRDLKPDNILFDREGNAFLADFGVVKLAESSTSFTQTGNILGTPAYMSPEQAKAIEQLDRRSDIYSLGVILYEMLTGDIPYKADTTLGQAMMHVLEPVPRILEANPDLPDECEPIIQTAMAKDRTARYASAGELAGALQAVIRQRAFAAVRTQEGVQPRAAPPNPVSAPTPIVEEDEDPTHEVEVPSWVKDDGAVKTPAEARAGSGTTQPPPSVHPVVQPTQTTKKSRPWLLYATVFVSWFIFTILTIVLAQFITEGLDLFYIGDEELPVLLFIIGAVTGWLSYKTSSAVARRQKRPVPKGIGGTPLWMGAGGIVYGVWATVIIEFYFVFATFVLAALAYLVCVGVGIFSFRRLDSAA